MKTIIFLSGTLDPMDKGFQLFRCRGRGRCRATTRSHRPKSKQNKNQRLRNSGIKLHYQCFSTAGTRPSTGTYELQKLKIYQKMH